MDFTSSQLVPSSFSVTRGAGDYFKMYPDTNTGAMIEWAWGVSRLIDGLEKTASQNKIDTKHIAVKGCSYAGKMALYAGAFDERIALTIPEESGGGGEASWRFMATQTGTEDLEAAQGTAWYAKNLLQFTNADAPGSCRSISTSWWPWWRPARFWPWRTPASTVSEARPAPFR